MKNLPTLLGVLDAITGKIQSLNINILDELEAFPVPIFIIDEQEKFEKLNTQACKLFGYPEQKLIGRAFSTVVPESHHAYFHDFFQKFMHHPFEFQGVYPIVDHAGHPGEIVTAAAFLTVQEKKKMMVIALNAELHAINEKQTLQALYTVETFINKLAKAHHLSQDKLLSMETAAGIARHDLKNKLHNIVLLSDLLLKQEGDQKTQEQMLKMIHDSAKAGLHELNNTRSIELMERGEYELKLEKFCIMGMLQDIHDRLSPYFIDKNIKFLIESDKPKHISDSQADKYYLCSDYFFTEMMLSNLLQNAVEASPDNETVTVSIKSSQMSTEISIHNWGTVPKEIRDRFFEKYITKGKRKGTGLGTYISKMIAEAHDGLINMSSNIKQGTYVVVVFPIRLANQINKAA